MFENKISVVGLTGSIGSGKTLVSQVFEHIGIPVYCSDARAKMLYQKPEVIKLIAELFSENIITEGQIDKKKLAGIVFNDFNQLQILNNCIHPLVREDFKQWVSQQNSYYCIMESAIIYESGWERLFDKIINVYAPEDLILRRVHIRDNQTEEEIRKRINKQLSQKEKNSRSDYVIINDNVQLVIPQVRKIHTELLNIANT